MKLIEYFKKLFRIGKPKCNCHCYKNEPMNAEDELKLLLGIKEPESKDEKNK